MEKISLESPMAHPAAVAPKAAIPRTIEPKPVTLERVDSKPATPRAATPSLAPQIDKPKPTPAAIHFIVLDFETTGGSPKNGHAIVEIGAVKLDIDGNTLSEFTELVNPGRPIPYQFATEIHGIRDRDVAHCDPVDKVWDRFLAWASGFAALIVHYVPFERQFIDALYRGNAPPFEYICTCQLARKIYRGAENHKLGTVCAHIGYQIQNAHRALPDARAAAHLFVDMVRRDPSIISRFTKAAPQAPRDAAVQPQTERPTTNNERKVPNAAPPIGIVSTRAGVKSQIVSEIPSPPESTLQYIRPRTGERHSKRPAGPIPTPRIQFDSGALTPAEERTLIAADEARSTRLVEEELCRKREAEQHKQFAELAQSPSCKITSHVLADGRALRGYFKENSLTGAGVCNWPDGRVYEGEFVNGEITGQGELTMPNGQIYAGAFVNGKLSGSAGRVRWATGATCDNLDMQFVTPSEPLPRQEPMPEPKQAKPVDNEVRQIQSVNEMFSEIAARQRQAEDRALIAADEPRQTRELEAQEKRYREDTCTEVEACPSQDPKSSDTSLSTPQRRNVGIALGFAIYAVPWIFVWITLLPGYSKTARYAAFGWLSFISAIFLAATILPPSPAQRSPHQGVHNATHRLGSSLPNTINTSSDPKTKVLLAAARSGEKLHIRYTKPYVNGVSERWISPQRVFSKHGETENYMEAHCHKRNEMRAQVNAPQRAWLWGIDSFGARRSA
ncbi:exonuclease domain-containing protein [Lamprocystis purpurea]|uniref:exonuclease domain-containing protein n=1 Tax=Lamprocystis purpurea TaxID=61598 RepID=UPI001FE1A037|nr:exonuclease domain-containing protein [Lamprocystis purpurea]